MSLIKKITSFFFEESDEDVIADDEIKDITLNHQDKDDVLEEIVKPVVDVQTEMKPKETQKQESSKFVNIEVEKEAKEPEPVKEKKAAKPKVTRHVDEKKEYEYTPVISPMFGLSETEKNDITEQKHPKKVARTIKKKINPLGTIISPYYGLEEADNIEEEKKPKQEIENTTKVESEVVEQNEEYELKSDNKSVQESLFSDEVMNEIKKEEEKTVPLESIISDDEKENLMQISLFGESTPIEEIEASMNNEANK